MLGLSRALDDIGLAAEDAVLVIDGHRREVSECRCKSVPFVDDVDVEDVA